MIIDTHTHIIPSELPDFSKEFGYGEFITLYHHQPKKAWMMQGEKKFREIDINCWDLSVRLEEMNKHGIDAQVLSTIPVMFSYWAKPKDGLKVAQFLNDHIAEIIHKHPNKFFGLATVPLQDVELSIQELERCKTLGFKGVQIGSNVNQKNLTEQEFGAFFSACEDLNMCVLVHPWQMMGQEHMTKYWLPWLVGMPAETARAICNMIFSGVFDKHPNLRVCFAHGGGSFIPTIGRIEHGWECRPDLVAIDNPNNPRNYLGKFWVDSHTCDHKLLKYIIDEIGADKIVQGSDYPFPLGESIPGELVRTAPITDKEKDTILSIAPQKWLGIIE
ncbi:MAG: 2-hydroxy-3-carboxy-6-oxo-7-methylocta-2,4-dienoate decarboxylase [Bacteroidia bacterium]|nr:MAG: 2-hydroxy-3-carboxy-6-oxo-7-methylocta-2,4-dienoate decarboxylase [Bacteroidia bacterium]